MNVAGRDPPGIDRGLSVAQGSYAQNRLARWNFTKGCRSTQRNNSYRGCPQAGFTLIEVLIALAISGLCLMMLTGIVMHLNTARDRMHDHAAVLDQAGAVSGLIGTLVGSVPTEMKDADRSNLRGRPQDVFVLARGPLVLDLAAETLFRLHFVPAQTTTDAGAGTLALAWTNPTTQKFFDETVATGLSDFRLAYRGRGSVAVWSDEWAGRVADLALVKATMTFALGRGQVPITAVFRVGSRLPQACVINPLFDGCPRW